MFNKTLGLLVLFLVSLNPIYSAECPFQISGKVTDEGTGIPLSYVNVFIQELHRGAITDDDGNFLIENVCSGDYHFIFSHIGCNPIKQFVHVHENVELNIQLAHSSFSLNKVEVVGSRTGQENIPKVSIDRQDIEDNINQNISVLLENETGVHLIKNGTGISKPIIQGMYGNRVTILNNGIPQNGQQWGNDHSPEIDPFAADKITVLKGANTLIHSYGNIGGVVLVEPKKIGLEPHLHGQLHSAYESNGRGLLSNIRFEEYNGNFAWRISSSYKRYGDRRSPDYFLNNTGQTEANVSIQIEKSWLEKIFFDVYLSSFNTTLGVLRGSHIGNLTDLEEALGREVPFYTDENFSSDIDAPKQMVSHQYIKLRARYYVDSKQSLEVVAAAQVNDRREFDIRRGEREDIPALDLFQFTTNFNMEYRRSMDKHWQLKIGNQNTVTLNRNDSETGILPLIPDYNQDKYGFYGILSKDLQKVDLDFGLRYDYEYQNVAAISRGIPVEILKYRNRYHTAAAFLGCNVDLTATSSLSFQSAYAKRNPAINELYSNGLHQGVSGIEEGDINLREEKSFKNTIEYKWFPGSHITFSALAYHHNIRDYIYLKPEDELRLTIRGAFPVFTYKQTDAEIYGLDAAGQFTLGSSFISELRYSFLKGRDLRQDIPLVFMPPNRVYGSLSYLSQAHFDLFSLLHLDQLEMQLSANHVFEQKELLADQDFVAAPSAYSLVSFKISTNVYYPNFSLRLFSKVDNLLNVKYRDYLNRQHYFSDDLGRSITTGFRVKF